MPSVQELFRRAIGHDDSAAMRTAFELLFSGTGGVSAAEEYELRDDGYVMEMPQSGERITGRDRMRAMQEAFPHPPSITINRVSGSKRSWLIEAVNDYGEGDLWHVIISVQFSPESRMVRDTRYYAKDFEAPAWRAQFTDPA